MTRETGFRLLDKLNTLAGELATPRAVRGFGVVRLSAGVAMVAAPALFSRVLGVDRQTAERVRWLPRMVGARELALGVDALTADADAGGLRSAYLTQLVSDAGDALALVAALRRGHVNRVTASGVVLFAAGGVAAELLALRAVVRRS